MHYTDPDILAFYPPDTDIRDIEFSPRTLSEFRADRWSNYLNHGTVDEDVDTINGRPVFKVNHVKRHDSDEAPVTLLVVDFGHIRGALFYPDAAEFQFNKCDRCRGIIRPARPCFWRVQLQPRETWCSCKRETT